MSEATPGYLRIPLLLEQMARTRHPQTLSQLAQRLAMPKTSLMRILAALVEGGFVLRISASRGYVLGPRATRLALSLLATQEFSRNARAVLADVVRATGETCNLNALEGDRMRYLERVETAEVLRLTMAAGDLVPLHCTASGKLALGLMGSARRRRILDGIVMRAYTPHTLTDRRALEQELVTVSREQIGVDREEFVQGMIAVAVPVLDEKGSMIAALACHGPTARISMKDLHQHVPLMRQAAARAAKLLGAAEADEENP